jgi:hypothetical protein
MGPLARGQDHTAKPFNDLCRCVKLKIRADLIEPRSVVRTNTAEIGEGGKTSFQESAPFPAPASSTTTGAAPGVRHRGECGRLPLQL